MVLFAVYNSVFILYFMLVNKKYWFSVKSILIYMHLHYLEVVVSNVWKTLNESLFIYVLYIVFYIYKYI